MRVILFATAFSALMLAAALSDGTVPDAPSPAPAAAVRAAAPPVVVAAPAPGPAPPAFHDVEVQVRDLRAKGAGENEVYRVRALALPARTVAELMEREQAERTWEERLAAYRTERDRRGPQDDEGLRARHFNAAEREQLRSYDKAAPRLQ